MITVYNTDTGAEVYYDDDNGPLTAVVASYCSVNGLWDEFRINAAKYTDDHALFWSAFVGRLPLNIEDTVVTCGEWTTKGV